MTVASARSICPPRHAKLLDCRSSIRWVIPGVTPPKVRRHAISNSGLSRARLGSHGTTSKLRMPPGSLLSSLRRRHSCAAALLAGGFRAASAAVCAPLTDTGFQRAGPSRRYARATNSGLAFVTTASPRRHCSAAR